MKAFILGLVLLLSAHAHAWIDGTYNSAGPVFTLSTVSVGGNKTVPFLEVNNGTKVDKGFPVVSTSKDEEVLVLWMGPRHWVISFKDGKVGSNCTRIEMENPYEAG